MPRKATPIPPIKAELKDLGVEEVRVIVEAAEREERRRIELTEALRAALLAGDDTLALKLARRVCGLEEQEAA